MLFIVDVCIFMCLQMRSLLSASSSFTTHSGYAQERPLAYNSENTETWKNLFGVESYIICLHQLVYIYIYIYIYIRGGHRLIFLKIMIFLQIMTKSKSLRTGFSSQVAH